MFVRKKSTKSGLISVQVIDKSPGRYRVLKTIGSSFSAQEIERMVLEGKRYIQSISGTQEIDFTDHQSVYNQVLSTINPFPRHPTAIVLNRVFLASDSSRLAQSTRPTFSF